ncbi:helix-turn-helix domain-containing protein [Asticcacaulis sp. SL142]|uniref:helix-turn-helix domain-containing protein n=1 Tax=Asticcacaulis sp. SL142 TaxID=2995155 RepID=UPI003B64241F
MGRLGDKAAQARAARPVGKDFSEGLSRGLSVIRALGSSPSALTLSEVARRLALPRATTRRAIITLIYLGYAEATDEGYRLSPKVLHLSGMFVPFPVSALVFQAVCDRLAEESRTTVYVATLEGDSVVSIAAKQGPGDKLYVPPIGARLSPFETAAGQVLCGGLSKTARAQYLHQYAPTAARSATLSSEGRLRQRLNEVAASGYALWVEEDGRMELAVPISHGSQTAAFALVLRFAAPDASFEFPLESHLPVLLREAAVLCCQLE